MKKIPKTKQRYLDKRAKKLHKKQLRRNIIREINILKSQRKHLIDSYRKKKKVTCRKTPAPKDFSLRGNPEDVIKYFNTNKTFTNRWFWVNFDLTDVEYITFDSIALLIPIIHDPSFRQWSLAMWKPPEKKELNDFFYKTWFYNYVTSGQPIKEAEINWKAMRRVSFTKKVSPKLARDITSEISSYVFPWKFPWDRCKPLYKTLVECMANTENHAWAKDDTTYDWWTIYYKDPETNIAYICFIDLWIWIIKSMKPRWKELLSWKFDWLWLHTNADKLLKILDWKIQIPSRTNEKKRWKWLIEVFKFSQEEYVDNFTIITNDVYLNLNNGDKRNLTNTFKWTFLYWEMHPVTK